MLKYFPRVILLIKFKFCFSLQSLQIHSSTQISNHPGPGGSRRKRILAGLVSDKSFRKIKTKKISLNFAQKRRNKKIRIQECQTQTVVEDCR